MTDETRKEKRRRSSAKLFVLIVMGAALVPLMLFGWKELYTRHLERVPPVVEASELPRGVGVAPVRASFRISDSHSGLDHLKVTVTNADGKKRELLDRELAGSEAEDVSIEFGGVASGVEEGNISLDVEVSDKSIWGTVVRRSYPLRVDFQKPKIDLLGEWPSIKEGSSGLIFYKAFDEEIGAAGVRIGSTIFPGYPAKYIDSDLEDKNLYVALFAVRAGDAVRDLPVRAFVEDTVGNASSVSYPGKILPMESKKTSLDLTEDFVRSRAALFAKEGGDPKSKFIDALKRSKLSDEDLKSAVLSTSRFDRLWADRFFNPQGSLIRKFGEDLSFTFRNEVIASQLIESNDYDMQKLEREVRAINDGIVSLAGNLGTYGRMVAIDHGLGLFSIYGNLREISTERGAKISGGEIVGFAGESGLKPDGTLLLEVRVHGIPADPNEWLSSGWYAREITKRVDDVRRRYRLPVKVGQILR